LKLLLLVVRRLRSMRLRMPSGRCFVRVARPVALLLR
jgi:hypothetical protein